jgi:hypothetical protein
VNAALSPLLAVKHRSSSKGLAHTGAAVSAETMLVKLYSVAVALVILLPVTASYTLSAFSTALDLHSRKAISKYMS